MTLTIGATMGRRKYEGDSGFGKRLVALRGMRGMTQIQRAKDPEKRRLWKKFQQGTELPEKDQGAVTRLINSLAGAHD